MSALAIDLGDKRCWIAIEIEKIAIAKQIVLRSDIIKTIDLYLLDYPIIDIIVVWLPYDLFWKDLKQLNKTKDFIRELENKYRNLKIVWVDERFTTFEAENISRQMWRNKLKRDDISASLILETYLNNL